MGLDFKREKTYQSFQSLRQVRMIVQRVERSRPVLIDEQCHASWIVAVKLKFGGV
jgi:hypothetical protein